MSGYEIQIEDYYIPSKDEIKLKRALKKAQDNSDQLIEALELLAYEARGFEYDEKEERWVPNYIRFAAFVNERMRMVRLDGEITRLYNRRLGYYGVVSDEKLKRLLSMLYAFTDEVCWTPRCEDRYWRQVKNKIPFWEGWQECTTAICLENRVFNTEDWQEEKHSPKYCFSTYFPVRYNPDATAPLFMKFLDDIFNGDAEVIRSVQEIFGYILYPGADYPLQKIFVFKGAGGDGKSTLLKILQAILGEENVSSTKFGKLDDRFGLSAVEGKRLNISAECDGQTVISLEAVKAITGGDSVEVEHKGKDAYSTRLATRFIVCSNGTPILRDYSRGTTRRLHVVEFNNYYAERVDGEEVEGVKYADKTLPGKLLRECEGILIWALEGLKRLKDNDWKMSECKAAEAAEKAFERSANPVGAFLEEEYAANGSRKIK